MANTTYATGDNETVKLWARKLFQEALSQTYAARFMGEGSDSLIQVATDTSRGPGDQIRTTLRMLLTGAGIAGDGTLETNEEALVTHTDDILIDQLRHAVRSGGKMSDQRIPFSVREEARMGLTDWWADRIDTWMMNQLAGNKAASATSHPLTGMNAIVAPTAAQHFSQQGVNVVLNSVANVGVTGSASASNRIRLSAIDELVVQAKTLSPLIRPIRQDGEDYYCMFLHPHQVKDLRTEVTTGGITWYDTQKARVQGGEMANGIFTGALGVYNGVVLHESTRVPYGNSGSATVPKTRRAIFCGAQAACMAFGQGYSGNRMSWVEELFDYGNQLGVSAGMIAGMKKTVFNSADFGTLVLDTSWTGA